MQSKLVLSYRQRHKPKCVIFKVNSANLNLRVQNGVIIRRRYSLILGALAYSLSCQRPEASPASRARLDFEIQRNYGSNVLDCRWYRKSDQLLLQLKTLWQAGFIRKNWPQWSDFTTSNQPEILHLLHTLGAHVLQARVIAPWWMSRGDFNWPCQP